MAQNLQKVSCADQDDHEKLLRAGSTERVHQNNKLLNTVGAEMTREVP